MEYSIDTLFSVKDKIAVVLGGTSGIGQAIARGYALGGAVTIAASRDQGKVDAVAAELKALGARTMSLTADVLDRASVQALCDAVVKEHGRVDILMVAAGTFNRTPSVDLTDEAWSGVIEANLTGSFRANQIFGRQMLAQGSGSIINTCSMTSFVSFNEVSAYGASKAGVMQLTKQLACEWATKGVRVNAIAPGVFRTALNSKALDDPNRAGMILGRTPMARFGNINELVGAAIFLGSQASTFVTGQVIAVDGGFLAKGI
ncbi:MAG: SDR family oxidoreductase [Bryobacteraceae bacterium]